MPGDRLLDGINGSRILDDSYNASPASSLAALNAMRAPTRRLVLLGDMAEPAARRRGIAVWDVAPPWRTI